MNSITIPRAVFDRLPLAHRVFVLIARDPTLSTKEIARELGVEPTESQAAPHRVAVARTDLARRGLLRRPVEGEPKVLWIANLDATGDAQ